MVLQKKKTDPFEFCVGEIVYERCDWNSGVKKYIMRFDYIINWKIQVLWGRNWRLSYG